MSDEAMKVFSQAIYAGSYEKGAAVIAAAMEADKVEIARLREIVSRYELGAGPDDWRECPGQCGTSCCGYHDVCRAALLENPDG